MFTLTQGIGKTPIYDIKFTSSTKDAHMTQKTHHTTTIHMKTNIRHKKISNKQKTQSTKNGLKIYQAKLTYSIFKQAFTLYIQQKTLGQLGIICMEEFYSLKPNVKFISSFSIFQFYTRLKFVSYTTIQISIITIHQNHQHNH